MDTSTEITSKNLLWRLAAFVIVSTLHGALAFGYVASAPQFSGIFFSFDAKLDLLSRTLLQHTWIIPVISGTTSAIMLTYLVGIIWKSWSDKIYIKIIMVNTSLLVLMFLTIMYVFYSPIFQLGSVV